MINQRLEKRSSAERGEYQDLLDIFMEEMYDEKSTRDRRRIIEGVIGQLKIFFFAGFETSSNLLAWAMIMLSVHQEWQARAREEAQQILGSNNNQFTFTELSKLKIVSRM